MVVKNYIFFTLRKGYSRKIENKINISYVVKNMFKGFVYLYSFFYLKKPNISGEKFSFFIINFNLFFCINFVIKEIHSKGN